MERKILRPAYYLKNFKVLIESCTLFSTSPFKVNYRGELRSKFHNKPPSLSSGGEKLLPSVALASSD